RARPSRRRARRGSRSGRESTAGRWRSRRAPRRRSSWRARRRRPSGLPRAPRGSFGTWRSSGPPSSRAGRAGRAPGSTRSSSRPSSAIALLVAPPRLASIRSRYRFRQGEAVERLCFTFEIKPGTETEYKRRHDAIWPELVEAIKDAGFSNYSLFRRGRSIYAYAEVEPDVQTAMAKLAPSEVNRRWSEWCEDVIVSLTDESGQLYRAEEVWHLDGPAAGRSRPPVQHLLGGVRALRPARRSGSAGRRRRSGA